METTQVSINRLVDKNVVVYLCNEMLIVHKNKKKNLTICDSKGGPREYDAQCNKLVRKYKYCMISLTSEIQKTK